jgi:hypothetical protein
VDFFGKRLERLRLGETGAQQVRGGDDGPPTTSRLAVGT